MEDSDTRMPGPPGSGARLLGSRMDKVGVGDAVAALSPDANLVSLQANLANISGAGKHSGAVYVYQAGIKDRE